MTFKRLSCLLLIVTCFFIAGCDFLTPTELPLETVDFVAANPPSGSTLQPDATITVTFDGVPGNVAVNPGAATLAGQTVTISGPFPAGSLSLVLAWGDGYRRVLNYTVAVEPPPPDDSSGTKPVVPKGMVLIPAGEFQMGSNAPAADDDEQPVHTVSVDAFFMDEHEVTNSNFKAFVRANPDWGKNRSGKANHAVVYVSWYAAVAYSKWVGKRLPTEAEWEYAARGGLSGKAYPWGDVIDAGKANYGGDVRYAHDATVGRYPPNGYGLYDMAGNVWEWCLDEYNPNFYRTSPRDNPLAGDKTVDWIINNFTDVKTNRVLRGGSWANNPGVVRVANRYRGPPAVTNDFRGFRCARSQ